MPCRSRNPRPYLSRSLCAQNPRLNPSKSLRHHDVSHPSLTSNRCLKTTKRCLSVQRSALRISWISCFRRTKSSASWWIRTWSCKTITSNDWRSKYIRKTASSTRKASRCCSFWVSLAFQWCHSRSLAFSKPKPSRGQCRLMSKTIRVKRCRNSPYKRKPSWCLKAESSQKYKSMAPSRVGRQVSTHLLTKTMVSKCRIKELRRMRIYPQRNRHLLRAQMKIMRKIRMKERPLASILQQITAGRSFR